MTAAYEALTSELFGTDDEKLKQFKSKCHKSFAYAAIFSDIKSESATEHAAPAS